MHACAFLLHAAVQMQIRDLSVSVNNVSLGDLHVLSEMKHR